MEAPERTLEKWMSRALRIGIWSSVVFIGIGLIGIAITPSALTDLTPLTFAQFISLVGSLQCAPALFLFAGIVLLCITPIARVVIALTGFFRENDWRFVAISLLVFLLLILEILYAVSTV